MSFTIACQKCGTRLAIPESLYERKIKGHIVTIGCKKCSADIRVDGTKPREETESKSTPPSEPAKAAPKPEPEAPPAAQAAPAPKAAPKTEDQPQPSATKAARAPEAESETDAAAKPSPAEPAPTKRAVPSEPKASPGPSPVASKPKAAAAVSAPQEAREPEARAKRRAMEPAEAPVGRLGAPAPQVLWSVSYSDDDDRDMSATQIAAALRRADIDEETIVWNEDMDDWKPIAEVPELAKLVPPPRTPTKAAKERRTATLADAPAAKQRESRVEVDKELARARVDQKELARARVDQEEGPTIRRDKLPIPVEDADKPEDVSAPTEGKPAEAPTPIISPFTKEAADDEGDVVSSLSAEALAGAPEKKPAPKPAVKAPPKKPNR